MDAQRALVEPGSAREQVESLMSRLPAAEACAVVEHLFGVLPLLDGFFRAGAVEAASSPRLGSLGLFTPTPEPGWAAAAVAGEPAGEGLLLRGEVRIPGPDSGGSIVLARLAGGEHRLAWIDHGAPGVERRGSRTGGAVRDGSPCWLALEGVAVRPGPGLAAGDSGTRLRPLPAPRKLRGRLGPRRLDRRPRRGPRAAPRRPAQRPPGDGLQRLADGGHGHRRGGDRDGADPRRGATVSGIRGRERRPLAVAAAAARTLAAVAARTAELRDLVGLEIDGPLAGGSAATLSAFLGGPLMIESELARALGIRDLPAREMGG